MSEEKTAAQSDIYAMQESENRVAIIAILATAFIILACIAACTFVAYVFFSNPPW
jgi:hypothetical protein